MEVIPVMMARDSAIREAAEARKGWHTSGYENTTIAARQIVPAAARTNARREREGGREREMCGEGDEGQWRMHLRNHGRGDESANVPTVRAFRGYMSRRLECTLLPKV